MILLTAIIFSCCCKNTVFASSIPMFSIGEVYGKIGENVTVDISVKNNPGFNALKLTLEYDEAIVELVSAENKGITEKMMFTSSQSIKDNPFVMVWASADNVSGDGIIATLTFKVLLTAAVKEAPLNLKCEFCSDRDGNDLETRCTSGGVFVLNEIANGTANPKPKPVDRDVPEGADGKIIYWWLYIVIPIPVIIALIIMLVRKK